MSGAGGSAVTKLPDLQTLIGGWMIAIEIRKRVTSEEMDAMVLDGSWVSGIEATREEVARAVGAAFSWATWERGKVEAWRMYADDRKGDWPRRKP